jgi:hypothetical protein
VFEAKLQDTDDRFDGFLLAELVVGWLLIHFGQIYVVG